MLALKRLNDYGEEHPWRFALVGFLLLALISAVTNVVFHHGFIGGLFGAFGASFGWAVGTSARGRGGRLTNGQKALVAALFVGGFLVLGWTLAVTGLLPR